MREEIESRVVSLISYGVPDNEEKRLNSLLQPLSIEDAYELEEELGWVSNFMFILNSEEDFEKVKNEYEKIKSLDEKDRELSKKWNFYIWLNSVWWFFNIDVDYMINYNVIWVKL